MINEIYLSKRIEATGGHILGLTDNCEIASTALCLMVRSLLSGYQDMVGIYPVKNLKAETQKQWINKIMYLLYLKIYCSNVLIYIIFSNVYLVWIFNLVVCEIF